jgi:hypothetical protein
VVSAGEFCTELLKALALEGFLPEAKRLLAVGRSSMLRFYPLTVAPE